ncbi:MAG: 6-bladed beta-propeller, partial [Bacteroidales bacterium]|nr:6-bladed beta-propeller [Bacteroidales bacterium]
MKTIFQCIVISVLCLHSCMTRQPLQQGDPVIIDVHRAINKPPEKQPLSSFAKSCKYVPLETNSESVFRGIRSLYLTGQYIITVTYESCLVFDRETGKFIRKIGTKGPGPNEYNGIRCAAFDEARQWIYLISNYNGALLCFDTEGKIVSYIPRFNKHQISKWDLLDSTAYVGSIGNLTGDNEKRMVVGNFREDSVYVIPNHDFFPFSSRDGNSVLVSPLNGDVKFYQFENGLYVKEYFNDTIFEIRKPHDLYPKYVFELGERVPPDLRGQTEKLGEQLSQYLVHSQSQETKDHLFSLFEYGNKMYPGIFDKKKQVLNIVDVSDQFPTGLENDISGGIPFWP